MAKSGSDRMVRIVTALVLSASVMAAAFFAFAVYGIYCERKNTSSRVALLADNVSGMKRKNEYQKDFHARFVNDEDFAERIIRETLGYSAPGEIIFKFDEKSFSPSAGNGVQVERNGTRIR